MSEIDEHISESLVLFNCSTCKFILKMNRVQRCWITGGTQMCQFSTIINSCPTVQNLMKLMKLMSQATN